MAISCEMLKLIAAYGEARAIECDSSAFAVWDKYDSAATRNNLASAIEKLEAERDALKAWKESAMRLQSTWDVQAVGKELGLKLGTDILPEILPGIQKLQAERDYWQKFATEWAAIAAERGQERDKAVCTLGEYHAIDFQKARNWDMIERMPEMFIMPCPPTAKGAAARVFKPGRPFSHLSADTEEELIAFGKTVGIRPEWIQHSGDKQRFHFDVTGSRLDRLLCDARVEKMTAHDYVKRKFKEFLDD